MGQGCNNKELRKALLIANLGSTLVLRTQNHTQTVFECILSVISTPPDMLLAVSQGCVLIRCLNQVAHWILLVICVQITTGCS